MENLVQCLECGGMFKRVSTTHLKRHKMSYDDYFNKYPGVKIEHPSVTEARKQTLDNMLKRYGTEEGNKRWKSYCDRQAETNKFEYKNLKYGMTRDEFNAYNKSRGSVGESNPNFGSSYYQRWVEKFGKEQAYEMNLECSKRKDNKSLKYMISRYGEVEGTKLYDEFCLEKSRIAAERILKNQGRCSYNVNAIRIIDEYGKTNGYNFQHAENGGEIRILNYFVDGYDIDNKIIFEYYEKLHLKRKEKDHNRLRRIMNTIGPGWTIILYWYNNKIEIIKT